MFLTHFVFADKMPQTVPVHRREAVRINLHLSVEDGERGRDVRHIPNRNNKDNNKKMRAVTRLGEHPANISVQK